MIIRRESLYGSNDLHVVYRPYKVEELLGNDVGKRLMANALDTGKVQHTQLFTGPAGCGKTTAARIMALGLNCDTNGISSKPCLECKSCKSIIEGTSIDVKEINVGQSNGKDAVDSIIRELSTSPFNSRFKVIIFDEAHELTAAAKDLLLKPTENGYEHVYFIFCTNQPEKLKGKSKSGDSPFLERCSTINFNRVSPETMLLLLRNVCEFEGFPFNEEVLDIIVRESLGVPRVALIWLNQIAIEGSWGIEAAKNICGLLTDEEEPKIIDICRLLNKGSFKEAVSVFDSMTSTPVETIRILSCNYFVACLKNSKKVSDGIRYSKILDVLLEPIYDNSKNGVYKWYNYMFKVAEVVLSSMRS